MKLLLFIISFVCIASFASAQANQTLNLQNSNGKLFRYGYEGMLTTADASAHAIATFPIAANEAGVLRARVVGLDTAAIDAVTGVLAIRYKKVAGTLTLGTPVVVQAIVTDTGLGSATFAFAAASNNIVVNVTGNGTTRVLWLADIEWTKVKK